MTALLIVIYIAFVSLGFPDSLFGVTWPIVLLVFCFGVIIATVVTLKALKTKNHI